MNYFKKPNQVTRKIIGKYKFDFFGRRNIERKFSRNFGKNRINNGINNCEIV
jgi:hypothetical protein